MTFHPRPMPNRVGPYNGQADEALPALANDTDEMLQMLFEDLNALDAKVDAGITAATSAASSASAAAVQVISAADGDGGSEVDPGSCPTQSLTIPVPVEGGILYGGPSGAIAQDASTFYFDAANTRIGMGSAAIPPTISLDIQPAAGNARMRLRGTAIADAILDHTTANAVSIFRFRENGSDIFTAGTGTYTADAVNFDIGDGSIPLLRINRTNGTVGITTNQSFTPNSALSIRSPNSVTTAIQGQMTAINDSTAATFAVGMAENAVAPTSRAAIEFQKDNAAATSIEIGFRVYNGASGTAEKVHIDKSGNVGIGITSSIAAKLQVVGGEIRVDTGRRLEFGGTSEYIIGTVATSTIEFFSASTARMKLAGANFTPSTDGATNLGSSTLRWGSVIASASVEVGTNPATTGAVRLANNVYLFSRNAANSANIQVLGVDGSNVIQIGTGNFQITLNPGSSDIQWGKALVALGGGAAPTLGTIGGSGPATAAQNSWMRVLDSTGAAFWVPAWK